MPLVGKAAAAHGPGIVGGERTSMENFIVQGDACDAVAVEIKT